MSTMGKYEILEELGAGAMGKVFHGRDSILQREVAIKIILASGVDVEMKQRFYREARSCGCLNHPNIVTVFELGEEEGKPYIAMEYLKGEDLKKVIDRKTFIPLEEKLQIMQQICDGLAHAHENNIVHRDIKPSNIFLINSSRVKILDFGIARVAASTLTRKGCLIGTPNYMAPEQLRGREVDARSDLFSAAVVCFELLTSEHPFGETTDVNLPRKILSDSPKSLRKLNPLLPEKLELTLNRALAKDPAERFQAAAEFSKSIRRIVFEVINQSEELVKRNTECRNRILETFAALPKPADTPWLQRKIANAHIDADIAAKFNPEASAIAYGSFDYFGLCAQNKELEATARVLDDISKDYKRVLSQAQELRALVDDGNVTEAERLLAIPGLMGSEYPEIAALKQEIETKKSKKKVVEDVAEVALTGSVDRPESTKDADLSTIRKRIKHLLEQDAEKCLAEIGKLPPELAKDPYIALYRVRAMTHARRD